MDENKKLTALTKKEEAVFNLIKNAKLKGLNCPTIREIRDKLGFLSTSSVYTIIARLRDKGYLRAREKAEGNDGRTVFKKSSIEISDQIFPMKDNSLLIPIVGEIAAGKPILATENHLFYIDFPKRTDVLVRNGHFGLVVKGDSMTGAGIMNGDIVIIEKTAGFKIGDIVAAMIGDSATVKRLIVENGKYALMPENPNYDIIRADNIEILGKVVSSIRYY